ncbi:DGQHR domain-containing protein [Ekhidna sp.]|uniref:DGQHR domain-containing protein n=1 Tax=Ekhidna sp. TaxID=2608089 RepID=UPI00351991EB
MNYSVITIKFLNQILNRGRRIGIAHVPFDDLRNIVAYTRREDNEEQYYQRAINEGKIESIKYFFIEQLNKKINQNLNSTALGTFPTSTLIALNQSDQNSLKEFEAYYNDLNKEERFTVLNECFLQNDDGITAEIHVPYGRTALIVDGQHRLRGLTKLYSDAQEIISENTRDSPQNIINRFYSKKSNKSNVTYNNKVTPEQIIAELKEFEFLCTVMLDFDIYDQSRVFADVNFNQKSVNKSLFYDIFGTYPDVDNNEIVLAHQVTEMFFNREDSIFSDNIKMLGSGPGLFSQSFFVESLLRYFKVDSIWGLEVMEYLEISKEHSQLLAKESDQTDQLKVLENKKDKIEENIFNFINDYFSVIFDYWEKLVPDQEDSENKNGDKVRRYYNKGSGKKDRYDHILLKTVGIGSLMRFIEFIYPRISKLEREGQKGYVLKLVKSVDEKIPNLFSNKGPYGGSSGFGTRNKIFGELVYYNAELLYQLKPFNSNEKKFLMKVIEDKEENDPYRSIVNELVTQDKTTQSKLF